MRERKCRDNGEFPLPKKNTRHHLLFLCIYFPRSIYGISIIQHYIVLLFTDYYTHYATIYYTMLHNTLYSQLDYDFLPYFVASCAALLLLLGSAFGDSPFSIYHPLPALMASTYLIYISTSIYLSICKRNGRARCVAIICN